MEKMPYRPELDVTPSGSTATGARRTSTTESITSGWREQLPVLVGRSVVLREMRVTTSSRAVLIDGSTFHFRSRLARFPW